MIRKFFEQSNDVLLTQLDNDALHFLPSCT